MAIILKLGKAAESGSFSAVKFSVFFLLKLMTERESKVEEHQRGVLG